MLPAEIIADVAVSTEVLSRAVPEELRTADLLPARTQREGVPLE